MKKKMWIFIILAVLLIPALTLFIIGRVFYPDNVAQTAPDGGVKGLKTRYYKADLANAEEIVSETIPTLSTYGSNWKLAAGDSSLDNKKVVNAEIPVVIFTDDMEIVLTKTTEEGMIEVNVRSASRIGNSDFGENRRHVVQILEALDKRFLNEK